MVQGSASAPCIKRSIPGAKFFRTRLSAREVENRDTRAVSRQGDALPDSPSYVNSIEAKAHFDTAVIRFCAASSAGGLHHTAHEWKERLQVRVLARGGAIHFALHSEDQVVAPVNAADVLTRRGGAREPWLRIGAAPLSPQADRCRSCDSADTVSQCSWGWDCNTVVAACHGGHIELAVKYLRVSISGRRFV